MAVALSRMGGDEELLQEIARVFIDDYPKVLAQVRQAIRAQDPVLLERSAHTLKGSVANFGAPKAVEAALELEQMGRNRQLRTTSEALARLEHALGELHVELEGLAAN